MNIPSNNDFQKLSTGIPGFDQIANGGLPEGRSSLLAGTSGSGKTVFALQFLIAGAREFHQNGVLVTFEETPQDLIRNVESFGWNIPQMIAEQKIAIVDASPDLDQRPIESGPFDLSALVLRIEDAIRQVNAKRVILDAISALFPQFTDPIMVRRELQRIYARLRNLDVTILMTMERTDEDGALGRFGVEEFVSDNIIVLRNRTVEEKRRRTIEIVKFRGATHQKGEYPFTIGPEEGLTVIPLSAIEMKQRSSNERISSGVVELDQMCGGGLYRDSIILVSGATGAGKTLTVIEYINAAIKAGERAILFGAEESREQLIRNATSWGADLEQAERNGLLRIICRYPEVMGFEDHLLQIKRDIKEFLPSRVAIDSISAFERLANIKTFREFVIGISTHLKLLSITGMFTNTTALLLGSDSITDTHISTITDTIILLRYVELHGQMRRGIAVIKMRGTAHDKEIREYTIDNSGLHIHEAFRGVHGILTGAPTYFFREERERLGGMFDSTDTDSS